MAGGAKLVQFDYRVFSARLLTVALVCIHTCQSIILFGGIPGDLADARLANCILEHDYQSMLGYARLFSPSQFYPAEGTLVYSDNHFGTAPVYAVFRQTGVSMERAFQLWLITIVALNAGAVLFLFRRLRVSDSIACPLVFFAASSASLVAKCGHPQVLPYFPFVFALAYLLEFFRTGNARALGIALLWWAYQNACYLYDGFFAILIFGTLAVLFCVKLGVNDIWREFRDSLRDGRRVPILFLVSSVAILAFIYTPYVIFNAHFGTRPLEELAMLAPNLGAWFSAASTSLFYPHQTFYKIGAYAGENTLFSGWFVLAIVLVAFVAGAVAKTRVLQEAHLLAAVSLIIIAAITTWHGQHRNAYLWLVGHVPSLRAFRSFARIGYLLFVVEAAAAGLFLEYLYRGANSRWGRSAVSCVAIAAAVEQLSFGQAHYLPWVAQLRTAAIIEQWRKAGDHQVMIFAPGYTNQGTETLHMDCWPAALALHRYCINGYSGNQPATHATFLQAPSLDNANALLAKLHLDGKSVSLVTDWAEAVKQRLHIDTFRISAAISVNSSTDELVLRPEQEAKLPVMLNSAEAEALPCDRLRIYASYRVYNSSGAEVPEPPSLRTGLGTVMPGLSGPVQMKVRAPIEKGSYELRLSIVQEGVAWWADLGATGTVVKVNVR
jgi:hypothetical protein